VAMRAGRCQRVGRPARMAGSPVGTRYAVVVVVVAAVAAVAASGARTADPLLAHSAQGYWDP